MNEETGRKYESTFIPCGDALEKMDEIGGILDQEKQNAENPEVSG